MYDKKRINELAYRYIETDDDEVFEELVGELVNLVRPLVRERVSRIQALISHSSIFIDE